MSADAQQDQHHADWGYSVPIPVTTPGGQQVTVQRGERNGCHIMHAETPDQSEFYFEVFAYDSQMDHAIVAEE